MNINRILSTVTIVVISMSLISRRERAPCSKHEWTQIIGDSLYPDQYYLRCIDNGRMDDAEVRRPDRPSALFEVYSRGAGYGEYQTLNEAKAQAERIVELRGL